MGDATFKFDMKQIEDLPNIPQQKRKSILNTWASYMLKVTRSRFRSTQSPDGQKWAKTKYKSKGKGKRFVRTLYGRGHLLRSIVKYFKNQWSVAIGTKLIYAKTHNEGASFKATKKQSAFLFYNVFKNAHGKEAKFSWGYKIRIPKREFLGINDADSNALGKLAEMSLLKGLQDGR